MDFFPRLFLTAAILAAGLFDTRATITLTTLASFDGTNGADPDSALVQTADGFFYGTTTKGGTNEESEGTIFRMMPDGTLITLHSFPETGANTPSGKLVRGPNGTFYGTLRVANGAVFEFNTNGSLNILYAFGGTSDGGAPRGGVVLGTNGNFYGITSFGGPFDSGTVFSLTPDGVLTTLASFDGTNGQGHYACALVQGPDGNFYGTTVEGGSAYDPVGVDDEGIDFGDGTVFRITPDGVLTTLVSFNGTNGAQPLSGLTLGRDGNFYGITRMGGANDLGTVFRMSPAGVLTTLLSFNGTNGSNPYPELLQASDGNFYGTTDHGGTNNQGTVFRMTPEGTLTSLISFNGTNGLFPNSLIQGADGNLYGTTLQGGPEGSNGGTVFRLSLPLQPVIQTFEHTGGTSILTWSAVAGQSYQPQYSTNLNSTNWHDAGGTLVATNGTMTITEPDNGDSQRFYRIAALP